MSLIVNQLAARRSSKGVYRFFSAVINNLNWTSDLRLVKSSGFKAIDRALDFFKRGDKSDVFWTPCLQGPLRVPNHVITVHDCINIEYIYANDWRLPFFKKVTQKMINNSVKIVAISESSKKSFLENYYVKDSQVSVIKFASDFAWIEKERLSNKNSALIETPPYILMVTNNLVHKNNLRAVQALVNSNFSKFGISLRIVGSIGLEECKLLNASGVNFSIHSSLNDTELFELYSRALFLFSPSLSEGHNLAIGEALNVGINVLCSEIPAHIEFYNGMVSFFNQLSVDSMIHSINLAIEKNGPWFAPNMKLKRTYLDVASDYRQLFLEVQQECSK